MRMKFIKNIKSALKSSVALDKLNKPEAEATNVTKESLRNSLKSKALKLSGKTQGASKAIINKFNTRSKVKSLLMFIFEACTKF